MSDSTNQPVVQEQAQQPAVMIDLHLYLEEVNLILNSLGNLPFNQVSGLIEKLKNQAIPQLPKLPEAEDTAEKKSDPAA
jgi:hypothetical protein